MKNILERLKSPVTVSALVAQIVLLVMLVNPELADTIKVVGAIVIEILTILGVLNNPTDRVEW